MFLLGRHVVSLDNAKAYLGNEWVWCRAGRGLGYRCFRRAPELSGTSHSPETPAQVLPAEARSQHQAFLDGPWQNGQDN